MKRKYPRKPVSLWAVEQRGEDRYFHHVCNLSRGGLFVRRLVPLPIGEHFRIELPLPVGRAISVHGVVVRATVDADPERSGNGLAFVGVPHDEARVLGEYLSLGEPL